MLAGIAGVKMAPELQDSIIQLGVAAIGLVEIIRKEQSAHATVPGQAFNPNAEVRKAELP